MNHFAVKEITQNRSNKNLKISGAYAEHSFLTRKDFRPQFLYWDWVRLRAKLVDNSLINDLVFSRPIERAYITYLM